MQGAWKTIKIRWRAAAGAGRGNDEGIGGDDGDGDEHGGGGCHLIGLIEGDVGASRGNIGNIYHGGEERWGR